MPRSMMSRRSIWLCSTILVITASAALAQFTASIQGDVKDPSGAGVAKAKIELVNTATGATAVATSLAVRTCAGSGGKVTSTVAMGSGGYFSAFRAAIAWSTDS